MGDGTMKYGIIDVGGGLRGIYGAGVLDRCLEAGVHFDCCIGVSAGSANMCSYVAGQKGRNKPFYDDYSFRKEYMSVKNLVQKHSYLDLSYVYGTLSNRGGENPLDYPAMMADPAELVIVAADARTGKARYFMKDELRQDDYTPLMASCCIPVIDQPTFIDGVPYYDGGLADPVPVDKALAMGCDRVAVIRQAQALEEAGRACIIAPDSTEGMATLTKDKGGIEKMYEKGCADAEKLIRWKR